MSESRIMWSTILSVRENNSRCGDARLVFTMYKFRAFQSERRVITKYDGTRY